MQINLFPHFITLHILTTAPFCPQYSETGLNTTTWVKKRRNALLNSHLEGEKSEKDGIIKRKSNPSFGAFIDPGEGGWHYQEAERAWSMEPSEVHV